MIDDLTVAVTNGCNSRCGMCKQWEGNRSEDLRPEEFEALFGRHEFAGIRYLNITGGEPFLREDIGDVVEAITRRLANVKTFFISTNGTYPRRAEKFTADLIAKQKGLDVNVAVSIDGDRDLNRTVRGIDSHQAGVKTIELCRNVSECVKTMISTTLSPANCSLQNLMYLRELADRTGSTLSFRMAATNEYYRNGGVDFGCIASQIREVIDFTRCHCVDNPFLLAQATFLETGEMPIMGSKERLKCKAGKLFVFVDAKGNIFPCINSTRPIGNTRDGIVTTEIDDLGSQEQCVCCTECTFYPMFYNND